MNKFNAVDKEGLTPLHLAVESNRLKVVLRLLQNGADKNLANKKGDTPLKIAENKNFPKIVSLLKQEEYSPLCTLELPTAEKVTPANYYRNLIYPLLIIPEFLIFFLLMPYVPDNIQLFINVDLIIAIILSSFTLCINTEK